VKPLDVLIAIAVPVIWGIGLVVAKPVVADFPPLLLMALRFFVAAMTLVWFVPIPKGQLLTLCAAALIGSTMQYGFTYTGLRYLDAGTTALVVQAEVPFLVLFAIAMVLTGACLWAVGQIIIRRNISLSGLTVAAWLAVMAAPQLAIASWLFESNHMAVLQNAGLNTWLTVLYLGLIMTAVGYGCWYHVLGRYPASRVGPFILLTPLTSVMGGAIFLGETLSAMTLTGGSIIILGVAILVVERNQSS